MRVSRTLLALAGPACLAGVLGGCVSSGKYNDLNSRYNAETNGLRQAIESLERAKTGLEKDCAYYRSQAAAKEAEMEGLRDKLRLERLKGAQVDALGEWAQKWGARRLEDNQGVEIGEALLFDAGSSELRVQGKAALTDLFQNHLRGKGLAIRVDGHTDSDPIRRTKAIYKSGDNYELAGQRALYVTLFLKQLGQDPKNLFFSSFGEHRPRVANDTKENKRRNRRVEIRLWNIAPAGGAPENPGAPPRRGATPGGEGAGGPSPNSGAGATPGPGPDASIDEELEK
ncbi:MAG: OmpA family protein [Planctomycetes bacterium]|nr:OmpA family protein [Planctomycetota bacterium]